MPNVNLRSEKNPPASPEKMVIPDINRERVKVMKRMLDAYFQNRTENLVINKINEELQASSEHEKTLSTSERSSLLEQTIRRLEKIKQFFTTVDKEKRAETPLERMAQSYEALPLPKDPTRRAVFNEAIHEHMRELIERAFDQHAENPEQYVSHGFDHSLNVADYTREIITSNESILAAAVAKYGISQGEAKFILEQVALFHDFGYPHVGAKSKAAHGMAGADIISSPHMRSILDRLIATPDANKDLLQHDLRDAILFHSADKVEQAYQIKIQTTRGQFLLKDGRDIITVISTFRDPKEHPTGHPHEVTEIFVTDERTRQEIQQELDAAASDTQRKTNTKPHLPEIHVIGRRFAGRHSDLKENKDKKLGLEYSEVDAAKDAPLHAIIRMTDNMDMRKNRFSALQRSKAFTDVISLLGDPQYAHGKVAIELERLEATATVRSSSPEEIRTLLLQTVKRHFDPPPPMPVARMEAIRNIRQALAFWSEWTTDEVLARSEHQNMDDATKKELRGICVKQNSESLRHFGGCEAIQRVNIERRGPISQLIVTVDRAAFERLNDIRVEEHAMDANDAVQDIVVGVGEYQLWRAEEAFRSISIGGQKYKSAYWMNTGRK